RNVREYADPDAARTLHVTGDRAAGRFDLACVDAVRLLRLQAEFTESKVGTALGNALDASLELLAVLSALWLQHFFNSPILAARNDCYALSRRRLLLLGPWASLSDARR